MGAKHTARWDHHVVWSMCPWCGALHDGAGNMTGTESPGEGDASLCMECGQWAIFTADGQRRKPTEKETKDLYGNREYRRVKNAYDLLRALHPERFKRPQS